MEYKYLVQYRECCKLTSWKWGQTNLCIVLPDHWMSMSHSLHHARWVRYWRQTAHNLHELCAECTLLHYACNRVTRFRPKFGHIGQILGLFQIRFQYILSHRDLKKFRISFIWSQSDHFWYNLTSLACLLLVKTKHKILNNSLVRNGKVMHFIGKQNNSLLSLTFLLLILLLYFSQSLHHFLIPHQFLCCSLRLVFCFLCSCHHQPLNVGQICFLCVGVCQIV